MSLYWVEIAKRALSAAWTDMGTNGLGWFIGLGSPAVASMLSIRKAPSGQKIAALRAKWLTELKNTALVAVAALVLITLWEATWNIPHQILYQAAHDAPQFRECPQFSVPATPKRVDVLLDPTLSLKHRTDSLADQILNFVYDREGAINDWKQQAVAQAGLDALDHVDNVARFRAELHARDNETQDRFLKFYWPQVVALEGDLAAAGVDLSPMERAVALDGPRKIGFMLSVLGSRIGKKPPYERVLTPTEARVMLQGSAPPNVEIYARLNDPNSRKTAEILRREFEKQGSKVNAKVYPLPPNQAEQPGISLIYPSGDATTELNSLIPAFEQSELETNWGIVPMKQPPTVLKIEVRPQSPEWIPHTGPASLIITNRTPHKP